MDKKSILIFGAGLNQYNLIEAANKLGLISVVLDPNFNAPGKDIADYFYVVEGNDYNTTKEIALKHKVAGLVTTQMEKPLRLMARLAKELGLRFHSPEVVERSLDKWLMKQTFLENHVPCARGKLFTVADTINEDDLKEFQYPLIIKPKDGTSSQGVFKIDLFNEINLNLDTTRNFSRNGEVIIEEFLDGPEFSVETITFQGQTTIIQYTEKFITPFPHTVEMGHLQPAELNSEQKQAIAQVVKDAVQAIRIDNSAAHTEVKLTKDGPKVVEIGARGGGDFISSYLTFTSTGVNMDEAIIKVALGEEPDLTSKVKQYSYIKYFELPVGKQVERVNDWQDILHEEDVIFAHVSVKPGDMIKPITESKKRPGFVIVKGSSRNDVIERAVSYEEKIKHKIFIGEK